MLEVAMTMKEGRNLHALLLRLSVLLKLFVLHFPPSLSLRLWFTYSICFVLSLFLIIISSLSPCRHLLILKVVNDASSSEKFLEGLRDPRSASPAKR